MRNNDAKFVLFSASWLAVEGNYRGTAVLQGASGEFNPILHYLTIPSITKNSLTTSILGSQHKRIAVVYNVLIYKV